MVTVTFLVQVFALGTAATASQAHQLQDGCTSGVPSGITLGRSKNLTIENGDKTRKYRLHVPKSYQTSVPVPLILSFHGRDKDMKFQEELSQFSNSSYGFEGISVYPEGVPNENGAKQWQGDPDAPSTIDDVAFTLDLIDELLRNYCIDTSRIYAAGKSNGGGFTGLLACDKKASRRIAAFAPVSGAFYLDPKTQELPPCNPTQSRDAIPIMEFHGFKDNTINYTGGLNTRKNANSTDVFTWVNAWARRNGFKNSPTVGDLCGQKARKVTTYNWSDTVVHYNYTNLYHDWPSTFPNGDTNLTTCEDAEATKVILKWFSKWTLGGHVG
ncbi:Alpha/Beta hydrolase protein [Clohesyomyces aquaticus]|uniref:feruloyl esterase n=1 Tax=Clohesyomyces aquaticus TaxID=1231657 RepID=A0A1Y2A0P7_9PLEO|nr:Alpha/Beta hydrolase protein [Clohesyomyces aquaticus]